MVLYLDDRLLFASSKDLLKKDLRRAQSHLENLGWILSKEKSNLIPSQGIISLGEYHRLSTGKGFPPRGKHYKGVGRSKESTDKFICYSLGSHVHAGASIPAVQWAHLHSRDLQQAILQNWAYGESLEKQISSQEEVMVAEEASESEQGSVLDFSRSKSFNNRCKLLGLGGTSEQDGPRVLDSGGIQKVLQLEGTKGHCSRAVGLQRDYQGPTHPGVVRQRHGGGIHLNARRHKRQVSSNLGLTDSDVGRKTTWFS